MVYDAPYNQASYTQSTTVIAAGGKYIRLGTEAQLARSNAEDMRTVIEERRAKMLVADLGKYARDPQYQVRSSKLLDGLKQGVTWFSESRLNPLITETVPFEAAASQRAFDAFLEGTNNIGKVVVRCGPNRE